MTEANVQILEKLNFKKIQINWVGKIGQYFIDVLDKQDSENEIVVTVLVAPNSNKTSLVELLDNYQKSNVVSDYALSNDQISITFNENCDLSFEDFLNTISGNLKSIEMKCRCQNCNATGELNYYVSGNRYLLLCDSCAEETLKKLQEEKKGNKNYVKGFFYSLVGALIGSLAWIILGAIGFMASIAGAAISYGAFFGYEKAHGKLTKKGIIINIVTIVLAFLVAQYAVLFIAFLKEYPDLKFLDFLSITPALFTDWEFVKSILPDIGLGLLFAFLGTSSTISKNLKLAKQNDDFNIEKLDLEN